MDELINKLVGLLESQQAQDAGVFEVSDPDEDGDITLTYRDVVYQLSVIEL